MKKWLTLLAMTAGLVSTGNAADINRLKTFTGVASQWPWQLNTDGTWTSKQPAFSDIAGSVTADQMPAFTGGDCTTSTGSVVIGCSIFAPSGMPNAVLNPLQTVENNRFDAVKWGINTANSDNAIYLNNAISNISAVGGGSLILPRGTIATSSVTLRSNVKIVGQGRGATIIRLNDNVNLDLFVGLNAYALFSSPGTGTGIGEWGLSDLTLDGNMANQSAGSCLVVYGYHYTLQNLAIKNCKQYGIRSMYVDYAGVGSMESFLSNVLIDTTGAHGFWFNGPHDSVIDDLIVIDASQTTDNAYYGVFADTYGNARWSAFHGWHRAGVSNRTAHQLYDSVGASNFTNSHFEGSHLSPLYLGGSHTQLDNSNTVYSAWDIGANHIDVAGSNNTIFGQILGTSSVPGFPATYGIGLIGGAAGNIIDLGITGVKNGALNSVSSGGFNTIRINGAVSTGPGYTGSINSSDQIDLDIYGATSNGNLHQKPNPYTFLSSITAGGATVVNDIDGKNIGVQGNLRVYPSGSTASWATITFNPSFGLMATWGWFPNTDNNAPLGGTSLRWTTSYAYVHDAKTYHTTQAAAPTASTCGTGSSVDSASSANAGKFTIGTGATACTLTFATAYPTNAYCTVTPAAQPAAVANIPYISAQSSTAFTVSGGTASAAYYYTCGGN